MNKQIQELTDKVISALNSGIGTSTILENPERFTRALIDLKKVALLDEITKQVAVIATNAEAALPAIIAALDQLRR